MTKQKATVTTDSTDDAIQILKEATCKTSSGKSTLTYQVGMDESGNTQLKVSGNDGGGFWSAEWVSFKDIQAALKAWPEGQSVTSMTFRKSFRGKSANTPGFLIAVLCAEKIIEPMGDKKRVHQACDPAIFIASVEALQGGSSTKPKTKTVQNTKTVPSTKSTPKAKTPSPEKVKTPVKATAKTPGKPSASTRKGK